VAPTNKATKEDKMNTVTDAMLKQVKDASFEDGAKYVLDYIVNELGIDITDTDIFEEFMNEETN
jgi:hypothetical protein